MQSELQFSVSSEMILDIVLCFLGSPFLHSCSSRHQTCGCVVCCGELCNHDDKGGTDAGNAQLRQQSQVCAAVLFSFFVGALLDAGCPLTAVLRLTSCAHVKHPL